VTISKERVATTPSSVRPPSHEVASDDRFAYAVSLAVRGASYRRRINRSQAAIPGYSVETAEAKP